MTELHDAIFVGAVTVGAALTDPLRHRTGWMLVLLAGAGCATGATWALVTGRVPWPYGIVGVLGAVLVWLLLVLLAVLAVEWPAFRRADVVFRDRRAGSRAVARVTPSTRTAGTWRVSSVAAWPRGRGAGTAVMADLIAEADRRGLGLELTPSSSRVRAWYEGLGFQPEHGQRLVRLPKPPPSTST